jgi:hypothetical protein
LDQSAHQCWSHHGLSCNEQPLAGWALAYSASLIARLLPSCCGGLRLRHSDGSVLSMIGFVPLPTQLLRIDAAVSTGLGKITGAVRSYSSVGFHVAGSKWGFFPCVMVHCGAVLCHVVALLAQRGRDVRLWTSHLAASDGRRRTRRAMAALARKAALAAKGGGTCHLHARHRKPVSGGSDRRMVQGRLSGTGYFSRRAPAGSKPNFR